MWTYKNLISVFIILVFLSSTIAQVSITLEQCQQKTRDNHPLGLNLQQLQEVNKFRLKSINSAWYPQFNLTGQATYQSDVMSLDFDLPPTIPIDIPEPYKDQYKTTLEISQLFYDGGTIEKQKELQLATNKSNQQQVETDLYRLKELVNQVYFSILLLQENQKLLNILYKEVNEKLKVVQSGVKNGVLLVSNEMVIKAEILKLEQRIEELNIGKSTTLNILSILTKEEYSESVILETPLVKRELNETISRPELVLFDYQKEKIFLSDKLLKSQKMPKLFAFAHLGYGRPGLNYLNTNFDSFYLVGLGFKWNLWDGNRISNDRQALQIQANIIENHKNSLDEKLKIDLHKQIGEIEKLGKAIEKDLEIIELRSKIVKSVSAQLDNGVITSTEYLTELNAETHAKINMETHKIQLIQAKVNYLTISGQ